MPDYVKQALDRLYALLRNEMTYQGNIVRQELDILSRILGYPRAPDVGVIDMGAYPELRGCLRDLMWEASHLSSVRDEFRGGLVPLLDAIASSMPSPVAESEHRVEVDRAEKSAAQEGVRLWAVVCAAIGVEYAMIRSHLVDIHEEIHKRGTVYEHGVFRSKDISWNVGLVQTGVGNVAVATEVERAIAHFDPTAIVFVGVAGGIKDVVLGDVVAATKVYGYESGKAAAAFRPRPDVGNSSYALVQRAVAVARGSGWLRRIKGGVPWETPKALVAPIAAGEKVVSSRRADVYKFIRDQYGDAVAVEMEGRGFLAATYRNQPIMSVVIRGISDLINGKSQADAAGSQETASRHASAFGFEILARLQEPCMPG